MRIYAALVGIAIAAHLRAVVDLGSPGYDETFSLLHYAALGPVATLSRYDFPNNHIAFNVLATVFFPAGTPSLLVTRLLSFGWFLGLLVSASGVAFRIAGRTAQIVTPAFLLLHSGLFTRMGRGYSMAMCLATLGWLLLLERDRSPRARHAPLCFLGAAAAVPSWFVLFGFAAMADAWRARTWASLRPWLASLSFGLLWYLPAGVFLARFWSESWLGQQPAPPAATSELPLILAGYFAGFDVQRHAAALAAAAAIGLFALVGAPLVWRRCGGFAALGFAGFALGTAASFAYPLSAAMRQVGMFFPLLAVSIGAGVARLVGPLRPRVRAPLVAGVAGLLAALPVLTGTMRLRPDPHFRAQAWTAAALRTHVASEDLVHASAPDSSVIVYLMGPDLFFHALDVILARSAWNQPPGDLWMVVRERQSDLHTELGRLRGYSTEGRLLPPELEFQSGAYSVYRLRRR